MSALQYSIKTIAPGSPTATSVRRIKIIDNTFGHIYTFPANACAIKMEVVTTNEDYRFIFDAARMDQQIVIPISELNDINGTTPARNNQTTDYNTLETLINV
jgi:hypothetical protein